MQMSLALNDSKLIVIPSAYIFTNSNYSLKSNELTHHIGLYGSYAAIVASIAALLVILWSCYHFCCSRREEKMTPRTASVANIASNFHLQQQSALGNGNAQEFHERLKSPSSKFPKDSLNISGHQPFSYIKPERIAPPDFLAVYRNTDPSKVISERY